LRGRPWVVAQAARAATFGAVDKLLVVDMDAVVSVIDRRAG
jgi:hypothetical protein